MLQLGGGCTSALTDVVNVLTRLHVGIVNGIAWAGWT